MLRNARPTQAQSEARALLRYALAVYAAAPPADQAALLAGLDPALQTAIRRATRPRPGRALGWMSDAEIDAVLFYNGDQALC